MNTDGTGFHTCKECHKTESLWNHTTTDHKEGEQLEDRRSVVASSCNSGDGTDQRVQSLMFMMMMTLLKGGSIIMHKYRQCFKCPSVRQLPYLDWVIFIWEKTSSQSWWIPKMLSNEELFIVLRRVINFNRDQKAAAIDCIATSSIKRSDIIKGILQKDKKHWGRGGGTIRVSAKEELINNTVLRMTDTNSSLSIV